MVFDSIYALRVLSKAISFAKNKKRATIVCHEFYLLLATYKW